MREIPLPLEFKSLNHPPQHLFAQGELSLLQAKRKIAIVGTRKPNPYARLLTQDLAKKIAQRGGVVVSGGALGIDILAHQGAFPRTIMIAPTDLEHIYPPSNAFMIKKIYAQALALSQYLHLPSPKAYHFIQRNHLVVALSECVIIPQADLKSGSMWSAKIALALGKPLYVFPHRIGESEGSNALLAQAKARAIYSIQDWVSEWFGESEESEDEILRFCERMPSFEEAYKRFGEKIYEYELEGKIQRRGGVIYVC